MIKYLKKSRFVRDTNPSSELKQFTIIVHTLKENINLIYTSKITVSNFYTLFPAFLALLPELIHTYLISHILLFTSVYSLPCHSSGRLGSGREAGGTCGRREWFRWTGRDLASWPWTPKQVSKPIRLRGSRIPCSEWPFARQQPRIGGHGGRGRW